MCTSNSSKKLKLKHKILLFFSFFYSISHLKTSNKTSVKNQPIFKKVNFFSYWAKFSWKVNLFSKSQPFIKFEINRQPSTNLTATRPTNSIIICECRISPWKTRNRKIFHFKIPKNKLSPKYEIKLINYCSPY